MSNYTIHCAGFDRAQKNSIAAILDLADSALNHSWTMVEGNDSDIVMINMADEDRQQLDLQYDKLAKYRIILVADNPQEQFQGYGFLKKENHAPPSLRVFVDLLNQLGASLAEAATSEPADKQEVIFENSKKKSFEESQQQEDDFDQWFDEGGFLDIDIPSDADKRVMESLLLDR